MTALSRRTWLRLGSLAPLAALALIAGCASTPLTSAKPPPQPIVFVHGNGDTAALWTTTIWRFESQGWPRDRLVAVDLPDPLARDDDTVAQPGRSSGAENAAALAAEVDRVLQRTGAKQVSLVGNSRGGNAIRYFIDKLDGAAKVDAAVLGGTPNHGVWNDPAFRPNNEFNGAGPFLTALNAPKGAHGVEVTPGVRWMTIRSDNNDKFAQPDGVWIGRPGQPTHVTASGPALKGALDVVLPGRDHREVAYHPQAFAKTYTFITGREPKGTAIGPEASPVLDGKITGYGPGGQTNRPLVGAEVEVWAVDPATGARTGSSPLLSRSVGADGRWGPLTTTSTTSLEFVIRAKGLPTTHIYRSPFPRSSDIVHMRPERIADADRTAAALVVLTRPRGYFGLPRDRIVFDGAAPAGVPTGVAGVSSAKLKLTDGVGRAVVAEFESGDLKERIVGRAWPMADNHVSVIELHQ